MGKDYEALREARESRKVNKRAIPVDLTRPQMWLAALAGCMRHIQDIHQGRFPAHGDDGKSGWQRNIEGCLGELVVAQHYGRFWCGKVGDLSKGDVGSVEVRTTWGDFLLMHKTDPPGVPYVLVSGINGSYEILGWIMGHEGQDDEAYWGDKGGTGRPCYWVPHHDLHHMDDFPTEYL